MPYDDASVPQESHSTAEEALFPECCQWPLSDTYIDWCIAYMFQDAQDDASSVPQEPDTTAEEALFLACWQWPSPDIYIDGCIAYMFSPQDAQCYLHYLFKTTLEPSMLSSHDRNWPNAIISRQPIPGVSKIFDAIYVDDAEGAVAGWVLDYDARHLAGTVVPQALWSQSPVRMWRHASDAGVPGPFLQWPVFFVHFNGEVGLPIGEAAEGQCHTLRDAQMPVPVGDSEATSIHMHLAVRARAPYPRDARQYFCCRSGLP